MMVNNYYLTQLHPPLYFILLKVYYWLIPLFSTAAWIFNTVLTFLLKAILPYCDFSQLLNFLVSTNLAKNLDGFSEFSSRLFSALCMLALNFKIFQYFKSINKIFIGSMVVFLISGNEKMINMAQDLKPYALFSLLFVLLMIEVLNRTPAVFEFKKDKKIWVLSTLLMLTHVYGAFVVLALIGYGFINGLFRGKAKMQAIFLAVLLLVAIFVTYYFMTSDGLYFVRKINFENFYDNLKVSTALYIPPPIAVVLLALFGGIFYRVYKKQEDSWFVKSVQIMTLVYLFILLISALIPIFSPRYLEFLIPFVLMLFVVSSEQLTSMVLGRHKIAARILSSVLIFSLFCFEFSNTTARNNFFTNDYKNLYPIDRAFEAIVHNSTGAEGLYFLEDRIFMMESLYQNKYRVHCVKQIVSTLPPEEKMASVSAALENLNLNEFFYIKIKPYVENTAAQEAFVLDGYKKAIVFSLDRITVFKFTKTAAVD
ncbi:MAG: hypothetical protein ACXVBD_10180 [Pseudobdellovibrio sp.]